MNLPEKSCVLRFSTCLENEFYCISANSRQMKSKFSAVIERGFLFFLPVFYCKTRFGSERTVKRH